MESVTEINENLKLIQNTNGLTFGTDAFLLSAFVSVGRNLLGADLGSGTGIIPLLCASKNKAAHIYAVEIQESFAEIINKNVALNGFDGVIEPICSDLRELKSSSFERELDFVTANPPYMKADSGKRNIYDEKFIARHEVCGTVDDFCAAAYRLLKHGGKFYAVWRPDRLCDLLCSMRAHSLEPKILTSVLANSTSSPSMVLVSATKGGASGMNMTPPLILYRDGTQEFTDRAQKIYDTLSFE
jgi:tRNA1Val (adenine37-N6)-methyltransferase